MKKYVLFGAGIWGRKAITILGRDHIEFFIDNDPTKWETQWEGIPIYSLESVKDRLKDYEIVISVSPKWEEQIMNQIKEEGLQFSKTIYQIQSEINRKNIERRVDYIGVYKKAIAWIKKYTINGEAIVNTADRRKGYPEVTGYFIPSLLRWGYRDLSLSFAQWLCRIQKKDGSWYDTDDKDPYVFDTAQILKGLLAVRTDDGTVDSHIKKGCDWIISNITNEGRLSTPTIAAWGEKGMCSELIHLYCLSPLIEASKIYGIKEYEEAAYKVLNYYKQNYLDDIMNFNILSHFYAYIMEALIDLGEVQLAKKAMDKVAFLQKENGAVPAYPDVDWVCSPGLFQFSLIWFRLGDVERGNSAFRYACKLQNETGGWYGSYLSETNNKEFNDYLPMSEISWTVKYFLDALYYKNLAEFNLWSSDFCETIEETDGRYQNIREIIREYKDKNNLNSLGVLDVGCGKGRYLNRLICDDLLNTYYAVDLSVKVMESITNEAIIKSQGSITCIPFEDNMFDITFSCEAMEHAIDIEHAVYEMARVTKSGGKIVILDKDKSQLGKLDICEWEQWIDNDEMVKILNQVCVEVETKDKVLYGKTSSDDMFLIWIGTVK